MHASSADIPGPRQRPADETVGGMNGERETEAERERERDRVGLAVHRACLLNCAVKHTQMLLFGEKFIFVSSEDGGEL